MAASATDAADAASDATTDAADTATTTAAIIDFHYFADDRGVEIVKELAVMDLTGFTARHWIFEPPADVIISDPKRVRTNMWLTDFYHGLAWSDGETPYDRLPRVLSDYTFRFDYVFVKGLEKQRFLQSRVVHFNIVNLEDYDCPGLNHFSYARGTACHKHSSSPTKCALHRVHALREWFLADFSLVRRFFFRQST